MCSLRNKISYEYKYYVPLNYSKQFSDLDVAFLGNTMQKITLLSEIQL